MGEDTQSQQHEDEALTGAGAVSEPKGDGPVTLKDRTEPGGAGSPDTNQAKSEPLAPTPDHPEPLAVPELSDMNVGAADPQAPTRPEAASPAPPGSFGGGRLGEETPVQDPSGTAHRATGRQGVAPAGESVDSDLEAGATRMGAAPPDAVPGLSSGEGDTASAPSPGDGPAPGSSQDQPRVEGIRLPQQ